MRGNVVDLAVGIIVGAAFTAIVASLVEDLLNPLLGLLFGGADFSNLFVVLSGERRPSLEATREGGATLPHATTAERALVERHLAAAREACATGDPEAGARTAAQLARLAGRIEGRVGLDGPVLAAAPAH